MDVDVGVDGYICVYCNVILLGCRGGIEFVVAFENGWDLLGKSGWGDVQGCVSICICCVEWCGC